MSRALASRREPAAPGAPGPRYQVDEAIRAWVRAGHRPGTLALVDPDGLGDAVAYALTRVGIRVETYSDPVVALARFPAVTPRAVVLSARAPMGRGAEVVARLRGEHRVTVLLALGPGDVEPATPVILAGASPVLDLPLRAGQLLRHLQRVWLDEPLAPRTLTAGALELDEARTVARLCGRVLAVTGAEFELLWRLAENAGRIVRRQDLWDLWPWAEDRDGALVAAVIRLRRKLAYWGFAGAVRTVRGVGYCLDMPPAPARGRTGRRTGSAAPTGS